MDVVTFYMKEPNLSLQMKLFRNMVETALNVAENYLYYRRMLKLSLWADKAANMSSSTA
jgi:hypothetical protein